MTRKQIKALNDIAAEMQYRKDSALKFENETRVEKNKPPLSRHICGEKKTPTGYMVLDGCVGVYYHEPAPDVSHDDDYDEPSDLLRREIEDQLENGDYYLVSAPFDGTVSSAHIRDLLRQHSEVLAIEKNRKTITLTAEWQNNSFESTFNAIYVRRAVEAVGGTVRLYVGKHRTKRQPYPFLIVAPGESGFDLDTGTIAIVMPIARR